MICPTVSRRTFVLEPDSSNTWMRNDPCNVARSPRQTCSVCVQHLSGVLLEMRLPSKGGNKIINFHTEWGIVIGKTAFFFSGSTHLGRFFPTDILPAGISLVWGGKKERWQSTATYLTSSRLFKVDIIAYKSRTNDCHESELGVCTHWFTAWS